MVRTSILLGAWPMLHCVSLALSVSRLDFVIVTGLLSLNSLFPSIYDINGCAITVVSLVFIL